MSYQDSFAEQYKHPKWQEKRLKVFQRDKFTCVRCGAKEDNLHAHHTLYRKGSKVWEYKSHYIITLCESCHNKTHKELDEIKVLLSLIQQNTDKYGVVNLESAITYLKELSGGDERTICNNFIHWVADLEAM